MQERNRELMNRRELEKVPLLACPTVDLMHCSYLFNRQFVEWLIRMFFSDGLCYTLIPSHGAESGTCPHPNLTAPPIFLLSSSTTLI